MTADNGVSAVISRQGQKLRKEPGRKDAGISPHAAMAQCGQLVRLMPPAIRQMGDAVPAQQRLVADLKEDCIAVPQGSQSQGDSVADTSLRSVVMDGGEMKFPGQTHDFRVLRHNHDLFELLCRSGFQAAQDQASPV